MAEILFLYNGIERAIKCSKKEKMEEIFKRFMAEYNIDKISVYFTYLGNPIINKELTFEELAKEEDIQRKKMLIRVNYMSKNIIKTKNQLENIICPICFGTTKIKIEDYNIFLYDCRNKHNIDNLTIDEFKKTQDKSKIKCEICEEVKNLDILYRCCTCENNICYSCKQNHEQTHNITDNDRNDKCYKHNQYFTYYCTMCNMNICSYCRDEHRSHNSKVEFLGWCLPGIDYYESQLEEIKEKLEKFKLIKIRVEKMFSEILDVIAYFYDYFYNIGKNFCKKYG